MTPAKPVVIVGAANIDEITQLQDPLQPGESNRVRSSFSLGGVAANVACAASPISPVILIAAIADDPAGHFIRDKLFHYPVDFRPLELSSHASGRYTAVLDQEGQLILGLADTEIAESISADEIIAILEATETGMSMLVLDANLSPSCIQNLCEWQPTIPIVAVGVSPIKTMRFASCGKQIEILFVNRHEAAMLCTLNATTDISELSKALCDLQFKRHVITDGAAPVLVRDADATTCVDAGATVSGVTESVSGAGDALAGATIAGLHSDMSLVSAVEQYGLGAARACLAERCSHLPATL